MLAKVIDKTYSVLLKMHQNRARVRAHKQANPVGLGTKLLAVFVAICIGGLLTAMGNSMYTWSEFFGDLWYGITTGSLTW